MNKRKVSEEFKIGKHGIGYVSDTFEKNFGSAEFDEKAMPTFQKLPRRMNDAAIESELKPGLCDLGDVLAFLENPPEGTKDGWVNLFYTPSFVVSVGWSDGGWRVGAWRRGDFEWVEDNRVFSPATVRSESQPSSLERSDTGLLGRVRALEERVDAMAALLGV